MFGGFLVNIVMVGLNYRLAPLEVREKFVILKEDVQSIGARFLALSGITGCVILSTCNRTEIYISQSSKDLASSLEESLCSFLGVNTKMSQKFFFEKKSSDAFDHLCKVAAGMDSQILGDDQIITQVRESLENARNLKMTDSYLETFFRTAIQAGKEIKTDMVISSPLKSSAPYQAVQKLKRGASLKGKSVVVIGNGIMGRMTAELLIQEQAHVVMTLREYRTGCVEIPPGVQTIGYKRRYEAIAEADIVVSATTSPHHTLHYEDFLPLLKLPEVIIDLAVPRDVEPRIGELGNIRIWTIDEISDQSNELSTELLALAKNLIEKHREKYDHWYSFKQRILFDLE